MADIWKERCLGAIQFRQKLGPLSFLFKTTRFRYGCSDMTCNKLQKAPIIIIKTKPGTDAGYKKTGGIILNTRFSEWHHDCALRCIIQPRPGCQHAKHISEIFNDPAGSSFQNLLELPYVVFGIDIYFQRCYRLVLFHAHRLGQPCRCAAVVEQIDQSEGNVGRIFCECFRSGENCIFGGFYFRQSSFAQIAQRFQSAPSQNLRRILGADA